LFLSLVAEITVFNEKRDKYTNMPSVRNVSDKAGSQNGCGVNRY